MTTASVQKQKPLQFIHITKNAGTTIENEARKHHVSWGAHFNQMPWFKPHCRRHFERHHAPLSHYEPRFFECFDTFAVVRHPYARALSEFYCRWGHAEGFKKRYPNAKTFNVAFRQVLQAKQRNPNMRHWRPQHEYIFDADGKQRITHIVRFEHLKAEFDALMQRYKLRVRIRSHANRSKPKQYTVSDFDSQTLALLNKVYARDFERFSWYVP